MYISHGLQPYNNRSIIRYSVNKCDVTEKTRLLGPLSGAAIKQYNGLYRDKYKITDAVNNSLITTRTTSQVIKTPVSHMCHEL